MVAYNRQGDRYRLHTVQVLTVQGGLITRNTVYQDAEVFALFELPEILP
jgi:RNA polymerase sigma-70 factor (ECF subfamily)